MSSDTESSLPRAGYLPVCYRCAPAHAPRPAGTGKRSQRAECCSPPSPPGPPPPSRPPPVQRSAERLSFMPAQRRSAYSERPGRRRGRESARGGAGRGGQGWPTRIALGIPTAAIRHTATQALSGGRSRSRAAGPGARARGGVAACPAGPVFKFFLSTLPEPARNLNQTSPAHRHSQNGEHYSPHSDIFTSRHDATRAQPGARLPEPLVIALESTPF